MPRLDKTLADYVAIAISPALIMLMVGSLMWFLVAVFYQGHYDGRIYWILACFVLAIVLIARIGIDQGQERAALFGVPLAIAVGLATMRFSSSMYLHWILLAVAWWAAHKLTWDCTLIDEEQDSSGQGLLQFVGFGKKPPEANENEDSPSEKKEEKSAEPEGVTDRVSRMRDEAHPKRQTKGKAHTPGVWIVYFSLAALPLFGLGQMLVPVTDSASRLWTFQLLATYVAAGLGLLVTTSFVGLRRYLRQRGVQMPPQMAGVWIALGAVIIVVLLAVCAILPRPAAEYEVARMPDFPFKFTTPERESNRHAMGKEGADKNDPDSQSRTQGKQDGSEPEGGKSDDPESGGKEGSKAKEGDGNKKSSDGKPQGSSKGEKQGQAESKQDPSKQQESTDSQQQLKKQQQKQNSQSGDQSPKQQNDSRQQSSDQGESPQEQSGKQQQGEKRQQGEEGQHREGDSQRSDQREESADNMDKAERSESENQDSEEQSQRDDKQSQRDEKERSQSKNEDGESRRSEDSQQPKNAPTTKKKETKKKKRRRKNGKAHGRHRTASRSPIILPSNSRRSISAADCSACSSFSCTSYSRASPPTGFGRTGPVWSLDFVSFFKSFVTSGQASSDANQGAPETHPKKGNRRLARNVPSPTMSTRLQPAWLLATPRTNSSVTPLRQPRPGLAKMSAAASRTKHLTSSPLASVVTSNPFARAPWHSPDSIARLPTLPAAWRPIPSHP